MKIKYIGPTPSVIISSTGQIALVGKTIEVEKELGESLCEQAVWQAASKMTQEPTPVPESDDERE